MAEAYPAEAFSPDSYRPDSYRPDSCPPESSASRPRLAPVPGAGRQFSYGSETNWRMPPQEVSVATKFAQAKLEAARAAAQRQPSAPMGAFEATPDSLHAATPYVPRLMGLAPSAAPTPLQLSAAGVAPRRRPVSGHAVAALVFALPGLVLVALLLARRGRRLVEAEQRRGRVLVHVATGVSLLWVALLLYVEYRFGRDAIVTHVIHWPFARR